MAFTWSQQMEKVEQSHEMQNYKLKYKKQKDGMEPWPAIFILFVLFGL